VATNRFSQADAAILSPYTRAVTITPNDNEDLVEIPRGVYASKGSSHCTVVVIMEGDDVSVSLDFARGEIMPIRVRRIYATGTDATSIVALY
jgi:hypothetical protein